MIELEYLFSCTSCGTVYDKRYVKGRYEGTMRYTPNEGSTPVKTMKCHCGLSNLPIPE